MPFGIAFYSPSDDNSNNLKKLSIQVHSQAICAYRASIAVVTLDIESSSCIPNLPEAHDTFWNIAAWLLNSQDLIDVSLDCFFALDILFSFVTAYEYQVSSLIQEKFKKVCLLANIRLDLPVMEAITVFNQSQHILFKNSSSSNRYYSLICRQIHPFLSRVTAVSTYCLKLPNSFRVSSSKTFTWSSKTTWRLGSCPTFSGKSLLQYYNILANIGRVNQIYTLIVPHNDLSTMCYADEPGESHNDSLIWNDLGSDKWKQKKF